MILVNSCNPSLVRRRRTRHKLFFADNDVSLIGRINSSHELYESRLSGTVLADQRIYLAGANFKVDVIQCHHSRERLGDGRNRCQSFWITSRTLS